VGFRTGGGVGREQERDAPKYQSRICWKGARSTGFSCRISASASAAAAAAAFCCRLRSRSRLSRSTVGCGRSGSSVAAGRLLSPAGPVLVPAVAAAAAADDEAVAWGAAAGEARPVARFVRASSSSLTRAIRSRAACRRACARAASCAAFWRGWKGSAAGRAELDDEDEAVRRGGSRLVAAAAAAGRELGPAESEGEMRRREADAAEARAERSVRDDMG